MAVQWTYLGPKMSMSKSISPSPDPARKQDAIDPSIEVPDNIDAEAKRQTDVENPSSPDQPDAAAPANPWQAIFSVQHNAYYFYNSQTNETTWINPLEPDPSLSTEPAAAEGQSHASTSKSPQPESSSSTSQETSPQPSASASHYAAMQAAAIAAGIDPSLAYLDPSLAASTSTAAGPLPNTFTAKFNARTGAFTTGDARDPGHLSEYEVSFA